MLPKIQTLILMLRQSFENIIKKCFISAETKSKSIIQNQSSIHTIKFRPLLPFVVKFTLNFSTIRNFGTACIVYVISKTVHKIG